MKKLKLLFVIIMFQMFCPVIYADLSSEFSGYTTNWEIGVSGLQSSYYTETKNGVTLPDYMFSLGPQRVNYPYGVGQVPTPGGYLGRKFDVGAIGVLEQGGNLIVRVASGLNPAKGYYLSWVDTWHSLGDVFITVEDTSGVSHFALLNSWPADGVSYNTVGGGHYDTAMDFHTQGGPGGSNLEGHLVSLSATGDVVLTGGPGSYYPAKVSSPEGLDYRIYAQGGSDIGDAGLAISSVVDFGLGGYEQDWFIQNWTIPIDWLSSDPMFVIGLHASMSCSNDQIGMLKTVVPVPGALILGLAGLGIAGLMVKRNHRQT